MNLTKTFLILVGFFSVGGLLVKTFAQEVPTSLPTLVPTNLPAKPLPVRLPGNKDLPLERFFGKEYYQSKMLPGALLQSVDLMTYREYMAKYGDGASVPSDVSPDRMVSVLTVDFPNGLKAENADYSQARVISARDAVTGTYLTHVTTGEITLQKGPMLLP